MAPRFIGAICCLYLCAIIQFKVLPSVVGQSESNEKVTLKCSDDQIITQHKINELCKVRYNQRCLLDNYKIAKEDDIFHPQGAAQKLCLIFQKSTINMLPVGFFRIYTSLRYIDLSYSSLQDIGDYMFSIATMIELNLRGNDLTSLSTEAFAGAVNLKTLDISYNSLSKIDPLTFTSLRSLQDLNLSNNKLSNQSFSRNAGDVGIDWTIESLNTLDLSHNRIVYYDFMPYDSFSGLKSLQALYLHHNQILIDYGAFSSNRNLRTLDFSNNNNPYFDLNYLLSVRNLENLYLNGNGISYAQQIDLTDVRSSFPAMKSLGISNNSFACEVLASIIRKLDKAGIELIVSDDDFINDSRNLRGVKCI